MSVSSETRTTTPTLGVTDLQRIRAARREFLVTIEDHRHALFAYCRRLTGNVWDAEDLVQETLTRAFARAAETHAPIDRPRAWLMRIATNIFVDQYRRSRRLDLTVPLSEAAAVAPNEADPGEVRDALEEVIAVLPPRERAAVVLKDVFDYPIADIAGIVGSSSGAVKSALHRGRSKLMQPTRSTGRHDLPDRRVLEAAAAAFTAYDAMALARIFLDDGVMYIVGMVHETGATQMLDGSFEHTFQLERDVRYSAEVRDFEGEPLVAVFSRPADGCDGPAGLSEVWRCETTEGRLRIAADYFFCPEVVTEIADSWGVPTVLHGYRYS